MALEPSILAFSKKPLLLPKPWTGKFKFKFEFEFKFEFKSKFNQVHTNCLKKQLQEPLHIG